MGDVFRQFFVGFEDMNALTEMRPRRTVVHYIKGWFPVDCLVVMVDYISIFVLGAEGSGASRSWRLGKSVRAFRILRLVRLLRMHKLIILAQRIMGGVQSDDVLFIAKMSGITVATLLIIHYSACYWFLMQS